MGPVPRRCGVTAAAASPPLAPASSPRGPVHAIARPLRLSAPPVRAGDRAARSRDSPKAQVAALEDQIASVQSAKFSCPAAVLSSFPCPVRPGSAQMARPAGGVGPLLPVLTRACAVQGSACRCRSSTRTRATTRSLRTRPGRSWGCARTWRRGWVRCGRPRRASERGAAACDRAVGSACLCPPRMIRGVAYAY